MPKRKDLIGNIYGDFKVIEMLYNYNNKNKTYCKCIDKNNKEYIIRQDALQSGATKHIKGACNAGTKKDISGQRFGLLTALYPTDMRASNGCVLWCCKCDCGNISYIPIGSLTRKHTLSCGCKKLSKGENLIQEYLTSQNIHFNFQHTFKDCKNFNNKFLLYFDFYIPQFNLIIEYDGQQHFEPFDFFGGEERLKKYKTNDKIKDDYCLNHNINMLRIPYYYSEEEVIQTLNDFFISATITA